MAKQSISSGARFYMGTKIIPADMPDVDFNLPDAELFDKVSFAMAVQWSHTGGQPNHLSSMRMRGLVARNEGRVVISGRGWTVSHYSEQYIEKFSQALETADCDQLMHLSTFTSRWVNEQE